MASPQLTLPLAKFSFATTSQGYRAPIPWTHLISENNLVAIFELTPSQNSRGSQTLRHRFKIINGQEILEDINLVALASAAREAASQARILGLTRETPETAIITRCPCVAVKYPTDHRQWRRFQIRFATQQAYLEAISIFQRAQVPIIEPQESAEQKTPRSDKAISGIKHSRASVTHTGTSLSQSQGPTGLAQGHVYSSDDPIQIQCPLSTSYATSQVEHAGADPTFSAQPHVGKYHKAQEHIPTHTEHSLQPNQLRPSSDIAHLGSTAPPSAFHETHTYLAFDDLRPLTAPVYDPRNADSDLPPERLLPFPIRAPSSQSRNIDRASEVTSKLQFHQDTAENLSEYKPDIAADRPFDQEDEALAKNIDTQLLLARVKARKTKTPRMSDRSTAEDKVSSHMEGKITVPPKKSTRITSCSYCRSKRRKCERNPESPDGTCVPCSKKGQKCSLVAEVASESTVNHGFISQDVTRVPNSQEEKPTASRPLRMSLQVNTTRPLEADSIVKQSNEDETATQWQTNKKRSSQLAMPAPKRLKRTKQQAIRHDDEKAIGKSVAKDMTKIDSKGRRKVETSVSAHKPRLETFDDIRSDATTMTATTLDLDPPPVALPIEATSPLKRSRVVSSRSKAATNLQPKFQDPVVMPSQPAKLTAALPDDPKENSIETGELFDVRIPSDLTSFLNMDPNQRNTFIDSFMSVTLFSDDFLELAKVVEDRWKSGMLADLL